MNGNGRNRNNDRYSGQYRGQSPNQPPVNRPQNPNRNNTVPYSGQQSSRPYDRRLTNAERQKRLETRIREVERRRADRKRRSFHILVTVVLAAIIFAAIALAVSFSLKNIGKHGSAGFIFGDGDAKISSAVIYSESGEMLLNMGDLASYLGLAVTGDSREIRYIADSGEEIRFSPGSRTVTVNGVPAYMQSPAVAVSDGVAVPYSFVCEVFSGLNFAEDKENYTVTRVLDATGAPVPVAFTLKANSAIETESEDNARRAEAAGVGTTTDETPVFSTDLSEYEMFMNVNDKKYLLLVNRENLLDSDYVPDELTDVVDTRGDRAAQKMCLYAEKALEALFIEMRAAGFTDVSVTSGYRSYSTQKYLYDNYVTQERAKNSSLSLADAQALVDKYSARPGTSEHQSGLCCDMHNLASADQSFKNQPAYKWLCDNAYKFGFILRFPEGKEDLTGYEFEPWHYRFVGRYHAKKIHDAGLCLEEYLETLK